MVPREPLNPSPELLHPKKHETQQFLSVQDPQHVVLQQPASKVLLQCEEKDMSGLEDLMVAQSGSLFTQRSEAVSLFLRFCGSSVCH